MPLNAFFITQHPITGLDNYISLLITTQLGIADERTTVTMSSKQPTLVSLNFLCWGKIWYAPLKEMTI